jgi:hypothetical protein
LCRFAENSGGSLLRLGKQGAVGRISAAGQFRRIRFRERLLCDGRVTAQVVALHSNWRSMTLLTILGRFLSSSEIFIPGDRVIMRRFVVFDSNYCGLYIHHICGQDHEALHNHPWRWSAALVLAGWYAEDRATTTNQVARRILRAGRVNFISQSTFHRIDHVRPKGAWTFYIHGPRAQRDGFLIKTGEVWTYRDASEAQLEATRPREHV